MRRIRQRVVGAILAVAVVASAAGTVPAHANAQATPVTPTSAYDPVVPDYAGTTLSAHQPTRLLNTLEPAAGRPAGRVSAGQAGEQLPAVSQQR